MYEILVTLFLRGSVVSYALPQQYVQYECEEKIEQFQVDWKMRRKNDWVLFHCHRLPLTI